MECLPVASIVISFRQFCFSRLMPTQLWNLGCCCPLIPVAVVLHYDTTEQKFLTDHDWQRCQQCRESAASAGRVTLEWGACMGTWADLMAAHYSSLCVEALNCRVLNCLICEWACDDGSLVAGQTQNTMRQREIRRVASDRNSGLMERTMMIFYFFLFVNEVEVVRYWV